MAFQEKYYFTYCDPFGSDYRVSILQDEFEGTAIELEAQGNPFRITYESDSGFKFDPIRASFATVSMVFGTGNGVDFEEFWTMDEREFKVEKYKDSILDWVGYVIPNGFQYELAGGLYYAEIKAADGLSTLEDVPFRFGVGEPYGTQDLTYNDGFLFPWVLMATEILRKLGLDLNLWTCVDVYEQSMTKIGDTRDADPLATSYANVKTYINDTERKDIPYWADVNEVFNCKEVLENLCYIFGAKVYQNKGVWRIKRVNVDADYGTGDTQRYWRKYNTLAVYLGREIVNNEVTIECATIASAMIGNDHVMSMDEVYGAFRTNYEYTFVRDGDSPVTLLLNGTFADFSNTSRLAAPPEWFRWSDVNKWKPRLEVVDISAESDEAGGYTTGLRMGVQASGLPTNELDESAHPYSSLRQGPLQVTKGDDLFLKAWIKHIASTIEGGGGNIYYNIFRCELTTTNGEGYFLVNGTADNPAGMNRLVWRKNDSRVGAQDDYFFALYQIHLQGDDDLDQFIWREYNLSVDSIPESGYITFDINGYGKRLGKASKFNPVFNFIPPNGSFELFNVRADEFGVDLPRPIITGLELGKIPNPSELPQENDYIYENTTGVYTLEVDPIEVLNGDVVDDQHVSAIVVPTNVSGLKNFWDTIDNKYGPASIGLITTKSIMNLYIKPFRILEGTIKSANIDFDTRFVFQALPGLAFIAQRGTFNDKRGYLEDVTFVEISNLGIPEGGSEGGNTLEPNWQRTGNQRCEKDEFGLNTGFRERQEEDINPNSETFGQVRWTVDAIPTLTCSLGEPSPYLWGTDDVSLDPNNLVDFTYVEDSEGVQCPFDNPGGEYIYFLHLDSLGVVESINTEAQDEIISDFQYLSDVIIEGYTYRVLRQNYVTADFEGLNINFIFAP